MQNCGKLRIFTSLVHGQEEVICKSGHTTQIHLQGFDTIPIKMSKAFFTEIEEIVLNFVWN